MLFLCPQMVEGCLLEEVAFHLHLLEVGRSEEEENRDGKTLVAWISGFHVRRCPAGCITCG